MLQSFVLHPEAYKGATSQAIAVDYQRPKFLDNAGQYPP